MCCIPVRKNILNVVMMAMAIMITQVMNTITTAIGIASLIKNDDDYDDADVVQV